MIIPDFRQLCDRVEGRDQVQQFAAALLEPSRTFAWLARRKLIVAPATYVNQEALAHPFYLEVRAASGAPAVSKDSPPAVVDAVVRSSAI